MPPRIQADGDDGAVTRHEYEKVLVQLTVLEGEIKNLRESIRGLEIRLDERAESLKLAVERADSSLMVRLESMNQFRQQIDKERGSYVTNDKLALELKAVQAEIEAVRQQLVPLQTRQDYNKGRDTSVQTILIAAVAIGALFIDLLRVFTGH